MKTSRRNALAASIASILGSGSLLPACVQAAEGSLVLEEVVTTAQRREENVQRVGIAITAFSAEALKEFGFNDAIAVIAQTPGLSVSRPGAGSINVFSVRGVTQADFAANQEGPVAVYVDEAYVSQNMVTNFTMFDMERVEVLRGPQGTLFGRNATGGLVHYVTAKPTDEFGGFAELQYGSKNRQRIEAAVGGGLTETVSARIAGVYNESDGLMENIIGKDGQAANDWAVRGQLRFEPSDALDILLKGEYAKDDSDRGDYFHRVAQNGQFAPAPATDFYGYRSTDEGDYWKGAWDFNGFNKLDFSHATARIEWNPGPVKVTYVGDFQDIDSSYGEDSEGSPNNVFNYTQSTDVRQWSQEVRVNWEGEGTRVLGGLYYLNIDGDYGQDSLVFGQQDVDWGEVFYGIPEPGGYNLVSAFTQKTRTWAAFAQADFDLTEKLKLTVGGRWTEDEKDYSFSQAWTNVDGMFVFFEGIEGPGDVPYFQYQDSLRQGDWSGKVQLDYTPDADHLWYASINRGIKSGGFNAPVDASGLLGVNEFGQYIPFDQNNAAMKYDGEVLTSYEAGYKSTIFDGRARFNAAAFYYDYSDYQIYNLVGLTQTVFNSDGTMWGGEIEFAVSPVDGLDLMLGASMLDSSVDLPPGIRPDGKLHSDAAMAPKWTVNGLARYKWPAFGAGSLAVQGDFNWRDKQIFNLSNTPVVEEDAYAVVNASVTYTGANDAFYTTVFVKNLFDKQYREYGFDLSSSFGSAAANAGLERWYGITVGYRWR